MAVAGSPFKVDVAQPLRPEKVEIFGPGVESAVKPNTPTHFTVDCRDAGAGNRPCITSYGIRIRNYVPIYIYIYI